MNAQPEFKSFQTSREQALCALLQDGPRTLDQLLQATGWDTAATRHTLLQLVAKGSVSCAKTGQGIFRIRGQAARSTR